ncbi:MAG: 6-bladed beta-propeller [Bacteroidota bacterium]
MIKQIEKNGKQSTLNILLFFMLLSGTVLFGCKNKIESIDSVKVDVNICNDVGLSEIAEDVKCIPLEITDSCIIDKIIKVKTMEGQIYIADNAHVFQFNADGGFVKQIGRKGRGPGEHQLIFDFCLNRLNGTINLLTSKGIIQFDENNNFIKSVPVKGFPHTIETIDNLIYVNSEYVNVKSASGHRDISWLYKYNNNLELIDSINIANVSITKVFAIHQPLTFNFSLSSNDIFFYNPVFLIEPFIRDTLHRFSNDSFEPYFRFDFGEEKAEFIRQQRIEDGFPYKKLNILNMYKASNYIFMEYDIDSKSYFGFYNQQNKFYYNTISGLDDDIYKTGKIIPRPLNDPEFQMYFRKYAYEVQGIFNNVGENDNPIIFLVRLKD